MKIRTHNEPCIGRKLKLYNGLTYTLIGEFIETEDNGDERECWKASLINFSGGFSENGVIPKVWLLNQLKEKTAEFV